MISFELVAPVSNERELIIKIECISVKSCESHENAEEFLVDG